MHCKRIVTELEALNGGAVCMARRGKSHFESVLRSVPLNGAA